MKLLLRQQKSTGVLETNSTPLMSALLLLLLRHILRWHIRFLAQWKREKREEEKEKEKEECEGEIKEYEVATSAAKVHRCSGVKLATTHACNAAAALTSHPSSAVLNPVPILRTKQKKIHNMHL